MKFPDVTKSVEEQDEDVLHAMLVWGEARGESPLGRAAVAHVPVTRLRLKSASSSRPAATMTLKDVMLRRWAFSCFNRKDPNRQKLLKPVEAEGLGLWVLCWRSAAEAREGQSSNPALGATHYCVQCLWSRPAVVPAHPLWFEEPEIRPGHTEKIVSIGGLVFAKAPF